MPDKYTVVIITADGTVSTVGQVTKANAARIASHYPEADGFQTEICRLETVREQEWY